uniref:E3 ubiquitin-protein ligase n=1 Tax=Echeneis naucrates TaxID=173247 RepID=A0A665UJW9_ECHNA
LNVTCVNGVGSTSARSEKAAAVMKEKITPSTQKSSSQQRQGENQNTAEESTSAQGDLGSICVCGDNTMSASKSKCGASMCSKCLHTVHVHCKVCFETDLTPQGIRGKMRYSKLDINVPGHTKDSAIKITYNIPDGIQGKGHPSPGKPFKGGQFEAFLPDCEKMRNLQLLPRLEKAFRQGLTFTVTGKEAGAKATWDCIPHKTSLQGGKSGNGYPDSTYLSRLSQVLSYYGLEEPSAKSYEQKNTSK